MDETVTNHNELESILSRGEKLQKQMADAIDPSTRAWESIHGAHHVPKTYVPPFMKDEFE
jgi:formiminotetrahydrofolate cyclodeaminase